MKRFLICHVPVWPCAAHNVSLSFLDLAVLSKQLRGE